MSVTERAEKCWEVERRSCGEVCRLFWIVSLRNKKAGKSVVKAASSDAQSMSQYAEKLNEDLRELTDDEFATKYNLGPVA